jgi:predicted DNA-binding transcriptional regulator YafY
LLRQLDILSYLAQRTGAFAEELADWTGTSIPTVKRDIAELRHLGALIISDRNNGYRLMNRERIRTRVRQWRELERDRANRIDRGL